VGVEDVEDWFGFADRVGLAENTTRVATNPINVMLLRKDRFWSMS
jgi:hypothetical protein